MLPLPLDVSIQPSRMLRRVLLLLHLSAAGALLLVSIEPIARLAGLAGLALSLGQLWRKPGQPVRLRAKADGALEIWSEAQDWQPVRLHAGSFVLPALSVIGLYRPEQRRPAYLVILPDSLPAADFRRLRVWLHWLGAAEGKSASASIRR